MIQYKLFSNDWDKNSGIIVIPGAKTVANIQNLQPSSSYHIRVIAENKLGNSEPSTVIQVATQEEGE